ncbi:MAG TPA: Lar family restriction alleviation protein [Candidatus Aphodovivens avistercoris]|nr:Lar family restriction alleviation protein [Candidatus Aphodovivens avistercoris]
MSELEPCPFCGGEAEEIEPPRKGYWMGFWRIRCTGCHALMHGSHRGMNRDAWNRRAERTCREEWVPGSVGGTSVPVCSNCGRGWEAAEVYCPNCGARVVKEE